MKKIIIKSVFIAVLAALTFMVSSCNKDDTPAQIINSNNALYLDNLKTQINNLASEPLNDFEISNLPFMREEEKLARDVYITLYNKWRVSIFYNISTSEQSHMDGILILLNRYSISDPVGSNAVGVFGNVQLQNLYTQLVLQGSVSLAEAYKVGATIEDLDIFDLTNTLENIDNKDIQLVYESLTKGSRNHLRSFYKFILSTGGIYIPQYISQAAFDAIISSAMETGF
jgi:hypothetical protein